MRNVRTPPSLKWLLDKRARLSGEIQKLEDGREQRITQLKETFRTAHLRAMRARRKIAWLETVVPEQIETLKATLHAIDHSISLHEIQIDPESIRPIKKFSTRLLPSGVMTRSVYAILQDAAPHPMSTTAIAAAIAHRCGLNLNDDNAVRQLRQRVRYRLKDMCNQGKLVRHHKEIGRVEGLWTLAG